MGKKVYSAVKQAHSLKSTINLLTMQLEEANKLNKKLQDEIDSVVLSPFQNGSKLLADIKLILQKKLIERGAI